MLNDKVILVTGAARGIGQQTAIDLAKQGAKLVLGDITPCEETATMLDSEGADYVHVVVDITDFEQCQAFVEMGVEKYGRIDGMAHLAALFANLTMSPFEDIPIDEFDITLKVNVIGTWNMGRAVAPVMRKAGKGSIVNVASNTAILGYPMLAHYVASKGAVISMSRTMARELGGSNIRVNSIAPTGVASESLKSLAGGNYDELMAEVAASQTIQRNATPKDITGAFVFLLSDASEIVTGQTIAVDCGLTTS